MSANSSTDILTQLQTHYGFLLRQFYSTLSYNSQRHPLIHPTPTSDPYTNPTIKPEPGPEDIDPQRQPYPLRPDAPESFNESQKELAEDLVAKGQQILYLVERLPGFGRGEEEQKREIEALVKQVEDMEKIKKEKRREMRECVRKLESVILGMDRSIPNTDRNRSNGRSV